MTASPTVTIRPARADDAAAIAHVLRGLGLFDHLAEEPLATTEARVAGQLARNLGSTDQTILIAEAPDGGALGYAAVHWLPNMLKGLDGYLSELFLLPQARGQGVGGQLLVRIEEEGRARGCTRLMLFNRRERESYQRAFYPKHGWVEREDVAFFNRWLEEDS